MEKNFRGHKYWASLTESQYTCLARLIKAICHKHQIPLYIQPEDARYKPFDKKGDVTGYTVAGKKKDRYVLYVWKKGADGKITYVEAP